MKRNLLGAILALALVAPIAGAQSLNPIKFGVAGGITLPQGDLGDDEEGAGMGSGYNVQGMIGFQAPMVPVGLRVDVMYNSMKNDADVDYSNFSGTLNGIFNLGMAPMVSPYLIGGVGMYNQKFDVEGVDSKTSFGLNGGVGVRFSLSGFSTFAEARYHHVMSEDDEEGWSNAQFVPISFGIMF
jgi:opacity protein-like surface antigen